MKNTSAGTCTVFFDDVRDNNAISNRKHVQVGGNKMLINGAIIKKVSSYYLKECLGFFFFVYSWKKWDPIGKIHTDLK